MPMEYFEAPGLDDEDIVAWDGQSSKLNPGDYRLRVDSAEVSPTKAGDGHNLILKGQVTEAADQANQGFVMSPFRHNVFLGHTGKSKKERAVSLRRLKQVTTACEVEVHQGGGFTVGDFVGKEFWATAQITASDKEQPDGTTVTQYFTNFVNERLSLEPEAVEEAPAPKTNGKAAASLAQQKGKPSAAPRQRA